MKQYLIIVFLFLSSFVTSQTIITNLVTGIHPETSQGIIFRSDTFHIKNNFIIWNDATNSTLYYIATYTNLGNNLYNIYCNTNGKLIMFIVDFNKEYIIVDNKLLFSKSLRL